MLIGIDLGTTSSAVAIWRSGNAIPGEVVQAVMDRTGFSEAQFSQAAQGNASPAVQCAYRVALLEVLPRRPGSVSADLLRIG